MGAACRRTIVLPITGTGAAPTGNAAAQHQLGLLYDKGRHADRHVLAHMWFSLARR